MLDSAVHLCLLALLVWLTVCPPRQICGPPFGSVFWSWGLLEIVDTCSSEAPSPETCSLRIFFCCRTAVLFPSCGSNVVKTEAWQLRHKIGLQVRDIAPGGCKLIIISGPNFGASFWDLFFRLHVKPYSAGPNRGPENGPAFQPAKAHILRLTRCGRTWQAP